jgi:uncharacterized repeat protein (TIGR01451 family)
VWLSVWNTGAEAMSAPENYIVIEDVIMYRQSDFQLDAGDSITVKMPANGSTWRIEAGQVAGYPFPDNPSAVVEACGGINTPGLVNAFPSNERNIYFDRYCGVVVGSFDPNDKAAVPTGYGDFNIIRANTDIEYKIRFQNTGTDTAFRVVIVDTLSQLVNPATVEPGASSHPYRLDVYPGGILHFVFDPILLPDSNVNEEASHGFVIFRIAQQPDLTDGHVISNRAAIYFDFNEPVITNTVSHTIGAPFISVQVDEPAAATTLVSVQPNPFSDYTLIELKENPVQQTQLFVFDMQGKLSGNYTFQGRQCRIERNGLPQGQYFFRIVTPDGTVASGKIQVY